MNKDFWERIDRLEELAGKTTQGVWSVDDTGYVFRNPQASSEGDKMPLVPLCGSLRQFETSKFDGAFIAAANPAMILEMIAEMRRLEKEKERLKIELHDMDSSAMEMWNDMKQLEKEVDWLATTLAGNLKIQGIKDGLRDPAGGHVEYWLEAARKAVSEDDNA